MRTKLRSEREQGISEGPQTGQHGVAETGLKRGMTFRNGFPKRFFYLFKSSVVQAEPLAP